jgi:ribose-phosphate pyrophosphokinase
MREAGAVTVETVTKKRLQLFSGRTNMPLAEEVAEHLGVSLGNPDLIDFPNSEIRCRFGQTIRGSDVFIMQSHTRPTQHSIWEQGLMIDAAKRASAKRITAVCPYYGYGRQDRKSAGREPISARLVADFLKVAGANRVLSVDLHSGQIQGFFDGPFEHLTAATVLEDYLRANAPSDIVIVSPDPGRAKVMDKFATHLNAGTAVVDKRRDPRTGQVATRGVLGDVEGRMCVLVDDEIDTAGTICQAADQVVRAGAVEVWALATHAVLSDPAVDRLKNSVISRVVVTNTVPISPEKEFDKLEVVSVAGVIADAIDAVFEDTSVSELFGGENQG